MSRSEWQTVARQRRRCNNPRVRRSAVPSAPALAARRLASCPSPFRSLVSTSGTLAPDGHSPEAQPWPAATQPPAPARLPACGLPLWAVVGLWAVVLLSLTSTSSNDHQQSTDGQFLSHKNRDNLISYLGYETKFLILCGR